MKLPAEWMEKLQACHQGRSQVLAVNQKRHLSPTSKVVQEGDLILAVDSKPVCTFRDVEEAVGDRAKVELTLLRDEEVKIVPAITTLVDGVGTHRILVWAGMLLQCSYRAIQEMGKGASDIYCSYYLFGSPAHFYGIKSCRYIVAVNGTPVQTLDDLIKVCRCQLPRTAHRAPRTAHRAPRTAHRTPPIARCPHTTTAF